MRVRRSSSESGAAAEMASCSRGLTRCTLHDAHSRESTAGTAERPSGLRGAGPAHAQSGRLARAGSESPGQAQRARAGVCTNNQRLAGRAQTARRGNGANRQRVRGRAMQRCGSGMTGGGTQVRLTHKPGREWYERAAVRTSGPNGRRSAASGQRIAGPAHTAWARVAGAAKDRRSGSTQREREAARTPANRGRAPKSMAGWSNPASLGRGQVAAAHSCDQAVEGRERLHNTSRVGAVCLSETVRTLTSALRIDAGLSNSVARLCGFVRRTVADTC
jgi:hypothetical protein